ncbi:zinc-ribbon domain-containing protein [Desulfohalobiaceae bacterium Ax17]|uniref:zinc-ribbon domain-containing protein n=1 Tax=Desulfovulcanus ferrireducens TaxID=2831190 RepID=UPI00207B9B95|nr:zinc-ribbon domain-containing protein [Desulfovulcanus ferrireducens]MBT8764258.1 zinc-ribbon domain-containing protein [Desulfovulcanus ferrireducens]
MRITCPNCQFSQDIPEEKIPPKAEQATCPKCRHKFKFRDLSSSFKLSEEPEATPIEQNDKATEKRQSDLEGENKENIWEKLESMAEGTEQKKVDRDSLAEDEADIPWEHLEKYGFFPGLFKTIKEAMLSPANFFARMKLTGYSKPLVFYLLLAEVQAIANFIWQMVGLMPMISSQGYAVPGMGIVGLGSAVILILYPILLTILLFMVVGFNHLFLVLVRAGTSGFQGTFRAVTYGSAPMILAIIPFIGPLLGGIWAMVVTVIGYKNIHRTSYVKVFIAMFLPIILGIVLGVILRFSSSF